MAMGCGQLACHRSPSPLLDTLQARRRSMPRATAPVRSGRLRRSPSHACRLPCLLLLLLL